MCTQPLTIHYSLFQQVVISHQLLRICRGVLVKGWAIETKRGIQCTGSRGDTSDHDLVIQTYHDLAVNPVSRILATRPSGLCVSIAVSRTSHATTGEAYLLALLLIPPLLPRVCNSFQVLAIWQGFYHQWSADYWYLVHLCGL